METLPFASKTPVYSIWGYGDLNSQAPSVPTYTPPVVEKRDREKTRPKPDQESSREESNPATNYEYMPAVLLNSLKRDKKPFTYTPGRMDLSEVLNDKLRKRMNRRQKRAEERSTLFQSPNQELDSPRQVLVTPTYNSPLDMYSMENALEALEVQAEITVADKSHSSPRCHSMTLPRNFKFEPPQDYEPKNVAQSKAFRVLQIITDTDNEASAEGGSPSPSNVAVAETKPCEKIPSKYFHNLQKMTGTEDVRRSPQPAEVKWNTAHFHDEMKFGGIRPNSDIPSKLFHNLQKITGTEERVHSKTHSQNPKETRVHFQPDDESEMKLRAKQRISMLMKNDEAAQRAGNVATVRTLQRPAAFLPSNKPKQTTIPRFNSTNVANCQGTSLYGRTAL